MLPIVPRIYYTHHGRAQALSRRPARQQRDEELAIEIRRVRNATFPVYGPRRMWQQLTQEGIRVARCTVERLMRALGACQVTVLGRAYRVTTTPAETTVRPADLVERAVTATGLGQL